MPTTAPTSPTSARMPLSVGRLHFVGIGGIGMSGIAELLHNLGYTVQGSDIAEGYTVDHLRELGITVMIGAHKAEQIAGAAAVVISSAVKADNPEVVAARAARIPVVRRAEMLAELMRLKSTISVAGTHGKTTTTSLISTLLMAAEMKPTVINGGIINALGTNAILGEGTWMVVEADESDGTFIRIPSTVAVVTNIDPEHLDHYGSFETLKAAFRQFIEQLPFYGFGVLCADHPEVTALMATVIDRRIVSYGTSPQADVRAVNIRQIKDAQLFDVEMTNRTSGAVQVMTDIHLPMYGLHNVRNACAAIAVAREIGIADAAILKGLRAFGGVKRRFTKTGETHGVTIIDDYGHHPVEIAATLSSARQAVENGAGGATDSGIPSPLRGGLGRGASNVSTASAPPPQPSPQGGGSDGASGKGRVIAVVQPHRYTRLSSLFAEFCTCFDQADTVIVADVYSAGEEPIEGANRDALVEGIRAHGHKHVLALPSENELAAMIADIAKPNDFVICLGAGSISKWAAKLPGELAVVMGKHTASA